MKNKENKPNQPPQKRDLSKPLTPTGKIVLNKIAKAVKARREKEEAEILKILSE